MTVSVGIGAVRFDEAMLLVDLTDGQEISVPLEWYPKLQQAVAHR